MSPARHVADQVLVGAAHLALVAGLRIERDVEREGLPSQHRDPAVHETLDADLRPRQVAEDAHRAARPCAPPRAPPGCAALLVLAAMREIDARDVEARRAPWPRARPAHQSPARAWRRSWCGAGMLHVLHRPGPSARCFERRHRRQRLALDELEEGTAAGGDVGNPSSTPYFSIAASVSPPPASENALLLAIALAMACVPSPNWSNSNTPTGPFHTMVPAAWRRCGEPLGGIGPDVEDHLLGPHLVCRAHLAVRACAANFRPPPRRSAAGSRRPRSPRGHRLRHVEHLQSRTATCRRHAGGGEEGVGDAAADDQAVDLFEQALEDGRAWCETLEPPTIATSGRFGFSSARSQRVELARQQRAGAGDLREARHAVRGRLGAMRRAERVHHVDVAERRHVLARALRRPSSRPC